MLDRRRGALPGIRTQIEGAVSDALTLIVRPLSMFRRWRWEFHRPEYRASVVDAAWFLAGALVVSALILALARA